VVVAKVETIGDAYTCASGVPVRNPNHAAELAEMALAARVAVTRFKVSGLCSYGRGTNYSVCRFVELIHSDVNSHPEVGIGAHLVVVATCNLLLVYFGLQKITCLC